MTRGGAMVRLSLVLVILCAMLPLIIYFKLFVLLFLGQGRAVMLWSGWQQSDPKRGHVRDNGGVMEMTMAMQ